MSTVLVTGGTGDLGTPTVRRLRSNGHTVRILSRRPGPDRLVGDLIRGTGLAPAVEGADVVLHLATNARKDLPGTRHLLDAARAAGVRHLVYISIVGIERVPYSYYRDKLANEAAIAESGVPFTILRATQFHSFPVRLLEAQRRLPVRFALDVPIQPIDADEVAKRLVELAEGAPAGRVDDLGGPEILQFPDLAELWRRAVGERRRIRSLRLPGAAFRAFRDGQHLAGLPGVGPTFADWLAARSSG